MTDANGCIITATYYVFEPDSIGLSASIANVFPCFGDNNGSINLFVTGGISPYSYVWSNGEITDNIIDLTAGVYSVIITDVNGCEATGYYIIDEPYQLTINGVTTNPRCNGNCDGSINISITGGALPYSYYWSNSATHEDISTLCAGLYCVTVIDSNNCRITDCYNISQPDTLTLSGIVTPVTCWGSTNGSINITPGGGVKPYVFLWSNGSTTEDINSLNGGNYTVTMTDANGCIITATYNVFEPDSIGLSASIANVFPCFGNNNGSINLFVTGGISPYSYVWSNGEITDNISDLTAGVYSVIVTDVNGCEATGYYIIDEPYQLTINGVTTNSRCNGNCDGSIDISITGGTLPYSYYWSNSATHEDISTLCAGLYCVTVIDSNNCTITACYNISQPDTLTLSGNVTPVTCWGSTNGSINITPGGGVMPYVFIWSNGSSAEDINSLNGGNYTVTMTDANGCIISDNFDVFEPVRISISDTITNVLPCFGNKTGNIDITVSGGVVPYYFNWSNSETTEDISGLTAGIYFLTVTDANNCVESAVYTVSQPAQININSNISNTSCSICDGTILLTVTGGDSTCQQGYQYLWSDGSTTNLMTGLCTGNYIVTVTDCNECQISGYYVISQSNSISVTAHIGDCTCPDSQDGQINITVSGGTTPPDYSFFWFDSGMNPIYYTQDISGLHSGLYYVSITDVNNCSYFGNFTVGQPAPLTVNEIVSNPSCYTPGNNGEIDITPTGGTGPYQYLWTNGSTSQNLTGIGAGNYCVTITDSNSCYFPDANCDSLVTPPEIMVISHLYKPICCGDASGKICLNVSGGNPVYQFVWQYPDHSIHPFVDAGIHCISNLLSGLYSVTITDATGCPVPPMVLHLYLDEPPCISISKSISIINCEYCINLTVTGGLPDYTYHWSNGMTDADICNLLSGTYCVTVIDANNCVDSLCIDLPPIQPVIYSITSTNCTCNPADNGSHFDGTITLSISSGSAPYDYLWTKNGLPYTSGTGFSNTINITGLKIGIYCVTITDSNGCSSLDSTPLPPNCTQITQPLALNISSSVINTHCNHQDIGYQGGSITLTVTGETPSYSYCWSPTPCPGLNHINNLLPGNYSVSVSDSHGCSNTDDYNISSPSPLNISGSITNCTCNSADNPVNLTNDGSIITSVTGENSPYAYFWSNGTTDSDINDHCGTYSVSVTDVSGCKNTATFFINVPTAFNLHCTTTLAGSCYTNLGGTACVGASGETLPYSYVWSNSIVDTLPCTSNLGGGVYFATVTDAHGCWKVDTCVVPEHLPIVISAVINDCQCNSVDGAPTGSISLNVAGGVPPYTITCIDSSGNILSSPYTSLPPGYYCISITDAASCDTTLCYYINEPQPVTASFGSILNANCHGDCNGAINIAVVGGTAPYNFNWICNGACLCPFNATVGDLIGIGAGIYSVNVHDLNNCPQTGYPQIILTDTIKEPTQITISSTHNDCSNSGCCDGSINLNITGGIPPYLIQWTNNFNPAFISNLQNISCLCPGTYYYSVSFTGLQGILCNVTDSIIITVPNDSININCGTAYCASDLSENMITVHFPVSYIGKTVDLFLQGNNITPSGGPILTMNVPNYVVPNPPVYTFSPGAPYWVPYVINTLEYSVSVSFSGADPACNACTLSDTCDLNIYPVPAVTINDPQVEICCDSLSVYPGVPATVIGAPGTVYTVNYTVSQASPPSSLTTTYSDTINTVNSYEMVFLPLPPLVNCNSTICPTSIYTLTINSIEISFGSVVSCPGNPLFNTCNIVIVPNPEAILDSITTLPPSPVPGTTCEDDTIILHLTFNGVPPFYLLYSDGILPDPDFACFDISTGLPGCNPLTQIGTTCTYTGNIEYFPTANSTVIFPHVYIFSLYSVGDSNEPQAGCNGSVSGMRPMIVYPVPDAHIEDDSLDICGLPTVVFIPVELTGSPPFYITPGIENPIGGTITPQPVLGPVFQNPYEMPVQNPLPANTSGYFEVVLLHIMDSTPASCDVGITDSIKVHIIDQQTILATDITTDTICEGQEEASVCINLPGTGPWTVFYTQNNNVQSVTLSCITMPCCFTVNPSLGLILITGFITNGCVDTIPLNIPLNFHPVTVPTASLIIAPGEKNPICISDSIMLVLDLTGVANWNVSIDDGLGDPSIILSGITTSPKIFKVSPSSTTAYSIITVSDSNTKQCPFNISSSALVKVDPTPDAFFCCSDTSVCPCIIPNVCISMIGSPPFNVTLGDGVNDITENFATHTVRYLLEKIPPYCVAPYPVSTVYSLMSVTDAAGCTRALTGTTTITVDDRLAECPCYVDIPNSFSPNGDNINDFLFAEHSDNIIFLDFRVYNVWGDCIYETNDISFTWNGSKGGTDEVLDVQVFYYYLSAICGSGQRIFKKGNITLIK
ncbi:MAG: gliding motility-associated C-terminal domain-containing protein [Bacteroidia bacterium]|nr:gliding motility-associated C-terminal domain-containing protein [Bacteroidia bacterium]